MERIQTSTPLIFERYIPPPPRKLWSFGSPTEQLYRNKWTKYRNAASDDPWSTLDSPNFVDFKELPDVEDNYFDDAEEEKNSTPQRFRAHQRLPGVDFDNNNILEELEKCTLSAIKQEKNGERESDDASEHDETVRAIPDDFLPPKKNIFLMTEEHYEESMTRTITEQPPEQNDRKNNVDEKCSNDTKVAKKSCTIVRPFTFENREKFRQEHNQARRERDSVGKETRKGFRATPLPNYLKIRDKLTEKAKTCGKLRETRNNNGAKKINNETEIPKTITCRSVPPRKLSIVPKAPTLMTEIRARERQRFEEHLRKKELERQELKKKEEAARKKREEEEIAKLRRELVHKAQPIRKYKLIVPRVTKRELTDPFIPDVRKRQRKF